MIQVGGKPRIVFGSIFRLFSCKSRGPGIFPGYYEHDPRLLLRKIEEKNRTKQNPLLLDFQKIHEKSKQSWID